jgi:hypothetical protein
LTPYEAIVAATGGIAIIVAAGIAVYTIIHLIAAKKWLWALAGSILFTLIGGLGIAFMVLMGASGGL